MNLYNIQFLKFKGFLLQQEALAPTVSFYLLIHRFFGERGEDFGNTR